MPSIRLGRHLQSGERVSAPLPFRCSSSDDYRWDRRCDRRGPLLALGDPRRNTGGRDHEERPPSVWGSPLAGYGILFANTRRIETTLPGRPVPVVRVAYRSGPSGGWPIGAGEEPKQGMTTARRFSLIPARLPCSGSTTTRRGLLPPSSGRWGSEGAVSPARPRRSRSSELARRPGTSFRRRRRGPAPVVRRRSGPGRASFSSTATPVSRGAVSAGMAGAGQRLRIRDGAVEHMGTDRGRVSRGLDRRRPGRVRRSPSETRHLPRPASNDVLADDLGSHRSVDVARTPRASKLTAAWAGRESIAVGGSSSGIARSCATGLSAPSQSKWPVSAEFAERCSNVRTS